MSKGRKKIPDNLKVLKGTFRPHLANKKAPDPDQNELSIPSWLPVYCRDQFNAFKNRISTYDLDSASWTEAAAMIAMRITEIEECNRIIEAEGRTYKSEVTATTPVPDMDGNMYTPVKVMVKGHPAVAQKNEAMRHLQSLLSEFGLTPASLGKISSPAGKKQKQEDPWDRF